MSDEQVTIPPMTNTPEARSPTGEIIDQGSTTAVLEAGDPGATVSPSPAVPEGAPESYADFTAPEGQVIDPEVLAQATPIFKELNLPQEAAQKLIDVYNKQMGGVKDETLKAVEKMRTDWRDQIKADKDIGGILDAKVIPEIGRLKDKLPADIRTAFNTAMDFTGAGDHPAVVKALYKLAELVNEGTHVNGNSPSPHGQKGPGESAKPTIAGAMYPNLPH